MPEAADAPLPTTSPAPPLPAPAPPSAPAPGWTTSEAWISLLVIILGALPSSGLTANSPLFAKIVGMAIAALAALNYTAQRTALKRAYLATATTPAISRVPQVLTSAAVVALVVLAGVFQTSCGAATTCQDPKNAQSATCVVEGSVVDCTGVTSLASTVAVVTPIVEKLIVTARQANGSILWSSIEQQIVNLALQYGSCVIAEIWNALIQSAAPGTGSAAAGSAAGSAAPAPGPGSASLPAPGPGSASIARARLVPADLTAEFERIRARVAPGRKFKTSGATL